MEIVEAKQKTSVAPQDCVAGCEYTHYSSNEFPGRFTCIRVDGGNGIPVNRFLKTTRHIPDLGQLFWFLEYMTPVDPPKPVGLKFEEIEEREVYRVYKCGELLGIFICTTLSRPDNSCYFRAVGDLPCDKGWYFPENDDITITHFAGRLIEDGAEV